MDLEIGLQHRSPVAPSPRQCSAGTVRRVLQFAREAVDTRVVGTEVGSAQHSIVVSDQIVVPGWSEAQLLAADHDRRDQGGECDEHRPETPSCTVGRSDVAAWRETVPCEALTKLASSIEGVNGDGRENRRVRVRRPPVVV